jgi:hypothetical protein
MRPGYRLLLSGTHAYRTVHVAGYLDFDALVVTEDAAAIAPDCPPEHLLEGLRSIYPSEKEGLGVYALRLCREDDASAGCWLWEKR